jgi:hypothetical protein
MRICCRSVLAVMMMCLPTMVSGGSLIVNINTTIALQDFYVAFILCNDVLATSCNTSALFPLIHIEKRGSIIPAFPDGAQDEFDNLNFSSLWSGYITYIALPQDSSSNVVIALRNGFVTAGSPWPFLRPESQIAADLVGGSLAQQQDLRGFFLNHLSAFTQIGSQDAQAGTFWEFSNAVDVGSLSEASPEPSTMPLMALALAVLTLGAAVSRVRRSTRSKRLGV